MTAHPLSFLRTHLAHGWIVILFGAIYLTSQVIIGLVLEKIGGPNILALQVTGFSAADYIDTFSAWEQAGVMGAYHAHLVFDGVHPFWYAILMAATLAVLMEKTGAGDGWTKAMALPFMAGFCDLIENGIQHVFLTAADHSTIIDPLPAISTIMSISKWSLATASLMLIAILVTRLATGSK